MSSINHKDLENAIKSLNAHKKALGDKVVKIAINAIQRQLDESLIDEKKLKNQRKLLTLFFLDVVNSTSLLRDLDPEETLKIMDNALQQLAFPIEKFGGRVTRFMGDGFLAIFGLSLSHENDPEMAVRASLETINVSKDIASQLEKENKLNGFKVRIGINTGLAITGGTTEGENTVTGNSVNLASRLESSADPGGILISEFTYRHIHGLFDVEPRKPIKVKGFSEPINVFSVIKAKPSAFQLRGRGIEGIMTPMIGRNKEIDILKKSVEKLYQVKEIQSFIIIGDVGLGKSRLINEFEHWLIDQKLIYEPIKSRAALEYLKIPYALIRSLLASRFGISEDDPISIVKKKFIKGFQEVLGLENEVKRRSLILGRLIGYQFEKNEFQNEYSDEPQKLYDIAIAHLLQYFKNLALVKPLIFLLDDIHWADESSLDILIRLSQELSNEQIFFVALARPILFERRPSIKQSNFYKHVKLNPLSPKNSQIMINYIFNKIDSIPEKLNQILIKNTDGNPYYIEELVKMLLEEEIIVQINNKWKVELDNLNDIQIPSTLTGVLQSRLDRLPSEYRTVLQQASVIGRVFWEDILTEINESIDSTIKSNITDVLTALKNLELIINRKHSIFTNTEEYMFKQSIFREVTYETVLKRERQLYHQQVANWLIKQSQERVEELAGLIGEHSEVAGNKKEALKFYTRAANAALMNYALEEADLFFSRAINLTNEKDIEKKYSLLLGKEKIQALQGNRDEQSRILETLAKLVDKLKDQSKKVEILNLQAMYAFWTSDYSKMLSLAKESENLVKKINNPNLSQETSYILVWALFHTGEFEDAFLYAKDTLSLAKQLHDRKSEGNLLNILGLIKMNEGDFYSAQEYLKEFLSITRELKDQGRETTALNNIGVTQTRLGDLYSAFDYFQKLLDLAEELNDKVSLSSALVNLAWVTSIQQKWEKAVKYAEEGLKMKRENKHLEGIAEGLVWMGNALTGLNQYEKAQRAYEEALEIRQKLNQEPLVMGALSGLVRIALVQNDLKLLNKYNEKIAEYITNGGSLKEAWEPYKIYLTCIKGLKVLNDPRVDEVFNYSVKLLRNEASQIQNKKDRENFLENIPWHKDLLNFKIK